MASVDGTKGESRQPSAHSLTNYSLPVPPQAEHPTPGQRTLMMSAIRLYTVTDAYWMAESFASNHCVVI
jgi:hypothetical protein